MAMFEFQCRECGEIFEEIVIGGSTPRCPSCDGADLHKLFSAFAVGRAGNTSRSASKSFPSGGG